MNHFFAFCCVTSLLYGLYSVVIDENRRKEAMEKLDTLAFGPARPESYHVLEDARAGLRAAQRLSGREGLYRGSRVVVADYRIRIGGRGSYEQTYVAVERRSETQGIPFRSTLEAEMQQSGRWVVASIPKHTMTADEVKGYLDVLT